MIALRPNRLRTPSKSFATTISNPMGKRTSRSMATTAEIGSRHTSRSSDAHPTRWAGRVGGSRRPVLGLDVMRIGKLEIAQALYDFVAVEALPGTGVHIDEFWSAFEAVVVDLGPRNAALLARRDELQAQIDDWHRAARRRRPRARSGDLRRLPARHRLPAIHGRLGHGQHCQRRPRDRGDRRTTARGAPRQRPLRAQRSQRPLGQPVRRPSTEQTPSTRPRDVPRARATTPSGATRWWRPDAAFWTGTSPSTPQHTPG